MGKAFAIAVSLLLWSFGPSAATAAPVSEDVAHQCWALSHLALGPSARVESADLARAEPSRPDVNWAARSPAPKQATLPLFCKVIVTSMPAVSSRIRVEVWLPVTGWNGRMLGTGNGGYPDSIDYQGMAAGLVRHFATVSTDLGLAAYVPAGKAASGEDLTDIFVRHPIATRDFATRATHEMTWIGKAAVRAFYGRAAQWSYFAGCSTGGMQAMSESQRYPEDYDGILAGDPGGNRARIHLGILWNFLVVWQQPDRLIPKEKLQLLHDAAVANCLPQEHGPAGKAFLDRPQDCRWDPRPLLCRGAAAPSCLTQAQLDAALLIYGGPRNSRTGAPYLHGLLPGSELGWSLYMAAATAPQVPYFGVFRAALSPEADARHFDWDRDAATFIDVMGPQLDSADPDIRSFLDRGGKLLFYHGGADQLATATDTLDYVAAVRSRTGEGGSRGGRPSGVRVALIPGMNHCQGGLGNDQFDGLGSLLRWRETGQEPAPDLR